MHPDLEAIVLADEEARSRVTLAAERREEALSAARAARDQSVDARRLEAREVFERELQAIREEGDVRLAEMRRQQAQYLASLADAGARTFDHAVALYLRIVCEAAP
jgi:DNA anti-recombination protein RmuC